MRLTLRTLLAYLDDMLDDNDEKLLKQKIEESSYATSLVARIQSAMDHPSLSAMSPDAVGPLENANVISEYLDSTLSAEQIAEVERVCLESDTTLAEAAACHQILTMVLGQPARVSDGLKERIYALPSSEALRNMEQQIERAPDASPSKTISSAETASYSSLDIPGDGNAATEVPGAGGSDDATIGQDDTHSAQPITPVGPSDSGVADAPTRLRNPVGHSANPSSSRSEAELVARTTRAMMREDGYGGMVRPSRITPWLVSLALVAVLLFALGKIFAPLSERRIAEQDKSNDDLVTSTDLDTPSPAAPIAGSDSDQATSPAVSDSAPTKPNASEDVETDSEDVAASPDQDSSSGDAVMPAPTSPADSTNPGTEPAETSAGETTPDKSPTTGEDAPDTSPEEMPEAVDAAPPIPPGMNPPKTSPAETDTGTDATDADAPPAPAPSPSVASGKQVAHLVNEQSVVLAQGSQANTDDGEEAATDNTAGWRRLWPALKKAAGEDAEANPEVVEDDRLRFVGAGQTVLAPSLYRPILAGDQGVEWTLAGPTRLAISEVQSAQATSPEEADTAEAEENVADEDAVDEQTEDASLAQTITRLHDGRLLLASTQENVTATWQLGPRTIELTMPESQTVLAIEVTHFRPLGMDPRVPANRMPVYRVIAVQGSVQLKEQPLEGTEADADQNPEIVTLESGQQWQGRGKSEAVVSDVERLPNWIDPPEKADLLVASAREGLLDFVSRDGSFDDKELEKELREAMAFRRVEVSALAAQTLLLIGRADVYFGATGILSTPRHRLYFTEHFQQLRQHMASDAEAAKAIDEAIEQAERADGDTLFELLVGYNNDQLEAGADAKLIEHLNSSSMSVRVLAIENLRDIVGDTLGYRPDQENVARRTSDIKKWQARLRRGDIRYSAED